MRGEPEPKKTPAELLKVAESIVKKLGGKDLRKKQTAKPAAAGEEVARGG